MLYYHMWDFTFKIYVSIIIDLFHNRSLCILLSPAQVPPPRSQVPPALWRGTGTEEGGEEAL